MGTAIPPLLRKTNALLTCILVPGALVLFSCGAEEAQMPSPANSPAIGSPGAPQGPCLEGDLCSAGLVCQEAICVYSQNPSPSPNPGVDPSPIAMPGPDSPEPTATPTPEPTPPQPNPPTPEPDAPIPPDEIPIATDEEVEPNNGNSDRDVNILPFNTEVRGAIAEPGDQDVFFLDTVPGRRYTVQLNAPLSSAIDGHITIIDTGRDGYAAGGDYQKLSSYPQGKNAQADFVALGEGGHFLLLRDRRNLGRATQGSENHTYQLRVTEAEPNDFMGVAPLLNTPVEDVLDSASALKLHAIEGSAEELLHVDVQATSFNDMNARVYVFSPQTGHWIARNDDRSGGNTDPLIDVRLTVSEPLLIAVENTNEDARNLRYTLLFSLSP